MGKTTESGKMLEIRDLTIHYETDEGICHAVNHISLDLEKGKTFKIGGWIGETVTIR